MNFEDIPFQKPAPNEETIVRWYNNNKNASVKSRKYKNGSHLHYKRLKGGLMINTKTGEEKTYNRREKKMEKTAWRQLKEKSELIQNNFEGNPNEKLFEQDFTEPIIEIKKIKKKGKNFRERLQRLIPNTEFISVLLYKTPYEPVIAIWLKTLDGTPIIINQATADKICNENERVKIIDITKSNVKKLSSYHNNKQYRLDCYPSGIEIVSWSKDGSIKQVKEDSNQYKDSEQKLIGYLPTFQKSKAQFVEINGERQIIQQLTFQEFVKVDLSKESYINENNGGNEND